MDIKDIKLLTEVSEDDKLSAISDGNGGYYSHDGKKLLWIDDRKEPYSYLIKEGTEVICNHAISSKKTLEFASIPESIKYIGIYAFSDCENLNNVELPKSLLYIGDYAFYGCYSFSEFIIPASVKYLGEEFISGNSIDCVTLLSPEPPKLSKNGVFSYLDMRRPFCVPQQFLDNYKNDKLWMRQDVFTMSIEEFKENELKAAEPLNLSTLLLSDGHSLTQEDEKNFGFIPYSYFLEKRNYKIKYIPDNNGFYDGGIVYYLNPENKTAIAFLGSECGYCGIRTGFVYGEDEEYYGFYSVRYLYIKSLRYEGIQIPETIRDIFVDNFPCKNMTEFYSGGGNFCSGEGVSHSFGHYITIIGKNIYNKERTRLLCTTYPTECKSIKLASTLTSIAPYALYGLNLTTLEIPESVSELDAPYLKDRISINFKGAIKKIHVPLGAKCRINNDIADVEVVGRDKQFDTDLIFKAPRPDMTEDTGKCIYVTRAGASPICGRSIYCMRYQAWSKQICLNSDHIAAINPIILDCYEQHEGCEIFIVNNDFVNKIKREEWPSILVYESYDIVLNKLKQAGWNE